MCWGKRPHFPLGGLLTAAQIKRWILWVRQWLMWPVCRFAGQAQQPTDSRYLLFIWLIIIIIIKRRWQPTNHYRKARWANVYKCRDEKHHCRKHLLFASICSLIHLSTSRHICDLPTRSSISSAHRICRTAKSNLAFKPRRAAATEDQATRKLNHIRQSAVFFLLRTEYLSAMTAAGFLTPFVIVKCRDY